MWLSQSIVEYLHSTEQNAALQPYSLKVLSLHDLSHKYVQIHPTDLEAYVVI